MRIAIVDDIAEERSLLAMRLKDQLGSRNVHADFFEYERGEDFLKAAGKSPFTILFLDIYMNGINGIETAKKLRSFDKDCLLIFTTTSTDHALEGFQVRATHYLVKPYTDKDLSALTEELLSRIPEPDRYIEIKVNGSDVQLPFKDIIYAEHFSHMIHIHTTGGQTLVTRQSFENFTAPLKEDPRFFPSSRGTIVNLEHATGFDDSAFVMKDGSTVLISRKLLKTARDKRQINVKASLHTDHLILIQVENAYDGEVRKKNGVFQSSKRKGNGVGIQSVRRISEKSGGANAFTYENGIFTAKIMLHG